MMATTHVLVGMAIATLSVLYAPEYTILAAVAGGVGGLFPDLDLYAGHRKTLHFPVYYPAMALAAGGIAILHPAPVTIVVAFFFAGAAAHASLDVLGGGLELRPWEARSDRAVYDHYRRQWLSPKRVIRYDGAPEDLGLAIVIGGPLLMIQEPPITTVVLLALACSVGYSLLRRPLAALAEHIAGRIPSRFHPYVPGRYHGLRVE